MSNKTQYILLLPGDKTQDGDEYLEIQMFYTHPGKWVPVKGNYQIDSTMPPHRRAQTTTHAIRESEDKMRLLRDALGKLMSIDPNSEKEMDELEQGIKALSLLGIVEENNDSKVVLEAIEVLRKTK